MFHMFINNTGWSSTVATMRVRPHLLMVGAIVLPLMSLAACSSNSTGAPGTSAPKATPIRTAPRETTTTAGPPTTPLPTAYPTLPAVTAAPPTWAPPGWLTSDVERFVLLVGEELDGMGADAVVAVERGFALLDNGTRIELTALAVRISAAPHDTWRSEISTYLLTALRPTSPDDFTDFALASPLLRIRVGTLAALGVTANRVVTQLLAGELVAAVVIDGPDRIVYVSPAQADVWGKTASELVLIAAGQTLAQPEVPEREGTYTTLTDDIFAASRILDPSTIVTDIPTDGVVVLIPNADLFLAVIVDSSLDEVTLAGLAQQVQDNYNERPDPASDDLYWWHDGILEVITVDGDELVLPAELHLIIGGE